MKKILCLFLVLALGWGNLSLKDKTIVSQKSLPVVGQYDNTVAKIVVNNQELRIKDNKVKFQLYFEKYGKNKINVKVYDTDGVVKQEDIKILFYKSFTDVPQNSVFNELATLGYYSGYGDNTFRPNDILTKKQLAMVAARILDIRDSKKAFDELAKRGILNRIKSKKDELRQMSRAEVLTVLCRLEGLDIKKVKGKSHFSDITERNWYYPYVLAAEKKGWLGIYKDKFLMPAKKVTRREFIILLAQLSQVIKARYDLKNWDQGFDKNDLVGFPEVKSRDLISLSFDNMQLRKIISLISKEADINIVLADNVVGRASGHFNDVYPEVALANVLRSKGYTYVVDGNLYRVIKINKPKARISKNSHVVEFKISYADIDDIVTEIKKLVPSLKDRIIVSQETSTILINKKHRSLGLVSDIISKLDRPPMQVMVEAKIFEISAEDSMKLGTKLIGTDPADSDSVIFETSNLAPSDQSIFVRSLDKDFQFFLNALETKSDFNMISSPRVIVVNNKEAVLETLDEVAYTDETVINNTAGTVTSKKLIFKNVGTKLKFIPHINEKGYITLELFPEISSSVADSDTSYPLTHTTKAYTRVVVKDGETFLLGGLLRDKEEVVNKKVPLLGDIPILGWFFKRKERTVVKKDVIIMITPKILDPFNLEDFKSQVRSY